MPINPQKTLNINNFLSEVRKSGFSRLNRIAINIKPPRELVDILKYKNKDNYLTYYAESVLIPGFELLTNDLYYGGPRTNIPVRAEYKDVSTTFLVDDDMRQKTFFDAWMNFINPKENKFDFRYRDEYIGEIDVFQISEDGNRISYGVRLYEVFPIAVSEVKGSWAEQEPVRLDVNFSYRYWRSFNADQYERNDNEAPEVLQDIEVVGREVDREVLTNINVRGRTGGSEVLTNIDVRGRTGGSDVLTSIDVRGTTGGSDVLTSIDVVGRRGRRNVAPR
jgi:hypothetical protein